MTTSLRPDIVTDFSQFSGLRADARSQSPEAVRKVAQQFEALMTQQMLKSARAASLGDDALGGGQMGFYQDMFDQQMASHLSSGRGLGIADLLVRQLQGRQAGSSDTVAATQLNPLPKRGISMAADSVAAQSKAMAIGGTHAGTATEKSTDSGFRSRSAAAFVAEIRPHAEAAAAELGVPARVLMAQAALETGWGRRSIRTDGGATSHNLFGIKADRRWNGAQVNRMTTEYAGGNARSESAKFRTYGSAAESFADYVNFVKSNPRYAEALKHGGDAGRYVAGLQKAGYATDPAYAQKILRVANGPTMTAALNATAPSAARRLLTV